MKVLYKCSAYNCLQVLFVQFTIAQLMASVAKYSLALDRRAVMLSLSFSLSHSLSGKRGDHSHPLLEAPQIT